MGVTTVRLFVGVNLPDEIRHRLAALSAGVNGAKWVAPENFHITLRFIGEVDRHQAADLDGALADIRAPAFDLALREVGKFGSRGRLRALWAGLESSGALVHLHDKVERASVRAGIEPEQRKFKPHVTLARFKRTPDHAAAGFLEDHAGLASDDFFVDQFVLFESTLGNQGAHYTPLRSYPLGAQDYDFDGLADEYAEPPMASGPG